MYHADWQADECKPDYEVRAGQAFWRDGTPDEAEQIMRNRIEQMRHKYPLTPDREAALIATARDSDAGEFQKGWPALSRIARVA